MSPHGRRRPGVRLGLELRYAARPRARRGPGGEIARPFPGRRQGEPRERRGPGRRWLRGRGAAGARLRPEVRAPRGGGSARVQPGPCAPALFAAGWGRRRLAERPELRGGGGEAPGGPKAKGVFHPATLSSRSRPLAARPLENLSPSRPRSRRPPAHVLGPPSPTVNPTGKTEKCAGQRPWSVAAYPGPHSRSALRDSAAPCGC